MTGWAQVNGLRGNAPIEERTKYDVLRGELVTCLRCEDHSENSSRGSLWKGCLLGMISAVMFALHGIAAVVLFIRRKRRAGIGEGLLAVGLFGILFSVGWTIVTMLARLFLPSEGFADWLNRDSVTLTILTIIEVAVYVALRPNHKEEPGS